jgi:biotin carboxyl carrier protein
VEPAVVGGTVVAPMPGTVLQVAVKIGDKVSKGQTLLVLEAMKMENEIMAPAAGVVRELNITQGVSVNAGDILVILS